MKLKSRGGPSVSCVSCAVGECRIPEAKSNWPGLQQPTWHQPTATRHPCRLRDRTVMKGEGEQSHSAGAMKHYLLAVNGLPVMDPPSQARQWDASLSFTRAIWFPAPPSSSQLFPGPKCKRIAFTVKMRNWRLGGVLKGVWMKANTLVPSLYQPFCAIVIVSSVLCSDAAYPPTIGYLIQW